MFSWRAVLLLVVLLCSQATGRTKNWPSEANKARKSIEAVWRRDLVERRSTGAVAVKAVFLIYTDGLPAILLNAMKTVFNVCYSDVWLQN